MTKLKWRLSKLPTVEELLKLVNDKVITQEEAKEVLFSQDSEEERDKDSLKSEIKFLRDLVDKLSTRNKIVEVVKETIHTYDRYPWSNPYQVWCTTDTATYTGGNSWNTTNTVAGGVTTSSNVVTSNFSAVNTF